jgi:hypothetical protein
VLSMVDIGALSVILRVSEVVGRGVTCRYLVGAGSRIRLLNDWQRAEESCGTDILFLGIA